MPKNRAQLAGTSIFVLLVLAAAAIVVSVAPHEDTMGHGIRSVYVHVALTITGMLGLAVAGLLGIAGLMTVRSNVHAWMRAVGRVGLLFYAAGVAVSVIAAWTNWGGLPRDEPILRASLLIVGFATLAHLLMPLSSARRVHAALSLVPVLALWILLGRTVFVMHPQGPVLRTAPVAMLVTFGGLTALFLLAGVRLAWHAASDARPSGRPQ